jgi:hypothetical protein
VEQTAHFFNSFFPKVSVDQFSQSMYISVNNQQSFFMRFVYSNQQSSFVNEVGGGIDSSSFSDKKAWAIKTWKTWGLPLTQYKK